MMGAQLRLGSEGLGTQNPRIQSSVDFSIHRGSGIRSPEDNEDCSYLFFLFWKNGPVLQTESKADGSVLFNARVQNSAVYVDLFMLIHTCRCMLYP